MRGPKLLSLALLVFGAGGIPHAARAATEGSTSGWLVEEVLSESQNSHAFDWRRNPLLVEVGYALLQEENSFRSSAYTIGVATSFGDAWIGRVAYRKVRTQGSAASESLSQTPFSQAGQPSRNELLVGVGYALVDGRGATPLAPRITDVGSVLYALAGLQYNHFANKDSEPVPGMQAVYSPIVLEVGLREQVFLPQSFGFAVEWTISTPVKDRNPDLPNWQRFAGLLSWSFGG